VRQALVGAVAVLLAVMVGGAVLWRRDIAELERVRGDVASARQTIETVRGRLRRCLGMVDAERSEVATCRRDAADAAVEAREAERAACAELVKAAEARGALDVERTDVRAVVEALRRRRR